MMELRIQLIPTGEIILPPGKNGEHYCNNCKVRSHSVIVNFDLMLRFVVTQLRLHGSTPTGSQAKFTL